jgi:predicted nucleic acid-binding protein
MKVLLDTNIIIDALQERQPFDVEAKEILKRAQEGEIRVLFTVNAAADIFYLYSKARDMKTARKALEFLLKQYEVVEVTHGDCLNAIKHLNEDFEDALVSICAARVQADRIVSRDEGFQKAESEVKVISPVAFLSELA